jgi:adenylosuccinate synthase
MNVDILMGMQYGSEGKGYVASVLAPRYTASVRSGGPNAGHCILHGGKEYKMRQIPCGWVNPDQRLYLSPAMAIKPKVLMEEVAEIQRDGYSVADRLFIHPNAVVILSKHEAEEGAIRKAISSTAEGVGAARRAKIERLGTALAKDVPEFAPYLVDADSWGKMLRDEESILLEGTQGAGLCITHGQYPFCTSWPCTAAQLLSDAGLPVNSVRHIYGVVRTKPIRVAGNSGPLKGETTFEDLGQQEEHTTVTKRVRRVAKDIDWDMLDQAMAINRPSEICLTFGDYLEDDERADLIAGLEMRYGIPVGYVGMGKDGQYIAREHGTFREFVYHVDPMIVRAMDEALSQVRGTLLEKRAKYGSDNINGGGITGVFYRAWDKIHRLKTQILEGMADDEDPWLDLAGYGIIAMVLRKVGRW